MAVKITFLLVLWGVGPLESGEVEFFEKKIRPVLVEHCYECHSGRAAEPKGGLRLDSREFMRAGGESGPAVVPHDIQGSLLIDAIRYASLEMPPQKKLDDDTIQDFERWIEMGAPDPRDRAPASTASTDDWQEVLKERRQWWSLHPVLPPRLPDVDASQWADHPIDRFLMAKLDAAGLAPAPRADTRTLVRRLRLFLTGVPPPVDELMSIPDKMSGERYLQYVDSLLSSPQFGERWARHWMDVVGFGETHGHEWNFELREVWRYRDYLIRAFNDDVPFDRLILEHIAGDLLTDPRYHASEGINESLIGTAFWRFGEVDHDDCRLFPTLNLDVIDHQIDTLTKAFQATTVACARCHDHKLDAISMRDYYALSGILASSRHVVHTIDSVDRNRSAKNELQSLKRQIREELAALWTDEVQTAGDYLFAAQSALDEDTGVDRGTPLDTARMLKWKAMLSSADRRAEKDGPHRLAMEDLEFPWWSLNRDSTGKSVAQTWQRLQRRYAAEATDRAKFNAEHFVPWADFRSEIGELWQATGLAVPEGIARSGDFSIANEGQTVVHSILRAGFHSHRLSSRLNACLRSPRVPRLKRYVSFEALGGDGGVWRHVYDNCAIQNAISHKLESKTFTWQKVSTQDSDARLVIEFATRLDDQGYPYLNHNKVLDAQDAGSFFGVARVVTHDCDESPKCELRYLDALFDGPMPRTTVQAAKRYADVLRKVVEAWARDEATDTDVRWLNWLLRHELLTNSCDATPRLQELTRSYRRVEAQLQPPRLVSGISEFDRGFDVPVRIGGDPARQGESVPRGYVQILSRSDGESRCSGSGRVQLAQQIARADNPLTSRVIVNRIWHHMFGAGLVRTNDDFGRLGERPSHPDLFDYLAHRFVHDGWSVKRLIRLLVSSQAFQMSGQVSDAALQIDPENRLLHHYPMRRLEAEAVRDSILAVSGRLDRRLYGRSIDPHRFEERPMRRLFSGPVDSLGRRSVYIKVTLTEEPPFLSVFNLPDPKSAKGRRDVTTVPAQSLTLLNDPFVIQQAELWARGLVTSDDRSIDARLTQMFLSAFARRPSQDELRRFRHATETIAQLRKVPCAEVMTHEGVWRDIAHALFNSKEFIFIP